MSAENPKLSELLLSMQNICNLIEKHPNFGAFIGMYTADRVEDLLFELPEEIKFVEKQENKEQSCSISSLTP